MRKYNVGDKFVIEIDEVFRNDADDIIHEEELYRIKGFESLVFDNYGLDKLHQAITPVEDGLVDKVKVTEAYNKGLEDAWELMKKIIKMYSESRKGILGTYFSPIDEGSKNLLLNVMNMNKPQEVLAKLEAYEKEQAEIKVGDVVEHNRETVFIVTRINKMIEGYDKEGNAHSFCFPNQHIRKTGKHIDLTDLFKQIGGVE